MLSVYTIVPSSRTDFYVDMSGQSSSQQRQLSTKQWSGNNCSDVPTKIQLRITQWIIATGRVNSGGLSIKHATVWAWQRAFRKHSSLFEGSFYLYNLFLNVSFLFQNSTLCWQNRIFCRHDIFSQKRLSTTALVYIPMSMTLVFQFQDLHCFPDLNHSQGRLSVDRTSFFRAKFDFIFINILKEVSLICKCSRSRNFFYRWLLTSEKLISWRYGVLS